MNVFTAVSLCILISSVYGALQKYETTFSTWMQDNNKAYTDEEFLKRFEIFKKNLDYIHEWNAKGGPTVLGPTSFADLTNEEYRALYLSAPVDQLFTDDNTEQSLDHTYIHSTDVTVDWRAKGVVTGVKNQGECISDWAFSATGAIESAYAISKGSLTPLSEQNLIDCSSSYGNVGCDGGLQTASYRYVVANKGIDTEASYPYHARQGTCAYKPGNIGATITSFMTVASRNEQALTTAINRQPVAVSIDGSHESFQLYWWGVYYEPRCSSVNLNRGALVVGYGTDDKTNSDYYIVKNSWGLNWGQQGYILMSRNKNNNCGIATAASFPVV